MSQKKFKIEDIKLKKAQPQDAEDICNVLFELAMINYKNKPELFKKPKKSNKKVKKSIEEKIKEKNSIFYIASYQGIVIGVIYIKILNIKETPSVFKRREAHIGQLAVKKDFQKYGIGEVLMDGAYQWIKTQGKIKEITLTVWEFNKNAINFYEKLGFKPRKIIMSKIKDKQ